MAATDFQAKEFNVNRLKISPPGNVLRQRDDGRSSVRVQRERRRLLRSLVTITRQSPIHLHHGAIDGAPTNCCDTMQSQEESYLLRTVSKLKVNYRKHWMN